MAEEGTFRQLAQKLADGWHEVVQGLFEPEQTWLEENKMVVVVAVAMVALPILLCTYFYFSNKDMNKMDIKKNEKKIKQRDESNSN